MLRLLEFVLIRKFCQVLLYTHTRTHTYTHAHTHAHINAHTNTSQTSTKCEQSGFLFFDLLYDDTVMSQFLDMFLFLLGKKTFFHIHITYCHLRILMQTLRRDKILQLYVQFNRFQFQVSCTHEPTILYVNHFWPIKRSL